MSVFWLVTGILIGGLFAAITVPLAGYWLITKVILR